MKVLQNISLILMLLSSFVVSAKQLPDPDELHAVPTVLNSMVGLAVEADALVLFGRRSDEFVRMPFRETAKSRTGRFGEYVESERIKFPKTKYPGQWLGILRDQEKRRVIWDSSMLQLVYYFPEGNKIIHETTVPVDMLKPPADRMGEPPSVEVTEARKKFKQAYRKVFGTRYSGMASIPPAWGRDSYSNYLIASRIPGYPLLQMSCQAEDPVACKVDRFCFLEGGPSLNAKAVSGVAAWLKGKAVLVGNADRRAIHVYTWNSCFDVRYQRTLTLPKLVEKISSITVDSKDRLWVMTEKLESQFDSNLYFWDADQWQSL